MTEEEDLIIKYPKKACYICGRAKKELDTFHTEIIAHYDFIIQKIEEEISQLQATYDSVYLKILKDTEGIQNLNFTIKTVKTDLTRWGWKFGFPDC